MALTTTQVKFTNEVVRPMIEKLREQIAGLRRSQRVQRAEILFVNL